MIKGKQIRDFDNRPLNTVPLNTGSTVLAFSIASREAKRQTHQQKKKRQSRVKHIARKEHNIRMEPTLFQSQVKGRKIELRANLN